MKFLLISLAVIAAVAAADLPSNDYLPPVAETQVSNEYLPPVQDAVVEAAPAHELAADGYRYKTQRRVVVRRNRRDVNELVSNEYLPPVQESQIIAEPTNDYLPPVQEAAPAHELAADGYRYKTHRRRVIRKRRDVNELASNEYLPPVQDVAFETAEAVEEAAPAHELAADGYRYKTQRRRVIRKRRDVNELPTNEYLPPAQEIAFETAEAVEEAAPAHELAADGYRYKTQRRRVIRKRRDVNELASNEYLPPVQDVAFETAEAVEEAAPAHELAADGYRYKTQRRRVIRKRRDVNELASNEYLPPVQDVAFETAEAVEEAAPAHELAADGYRYKTQRRRVIRKRRDVNELASNEYLPPVQDVAFETAEAVEEAAPAHELAADGYRYKTQRRRVIRKRRDVNELASNEYLPPVQDVAFETAEAVEEAAPAHELAADGYRYKTQRRRVIRKRRDVNELPTNEYLPPAQEIAFETAEAVEEAAPAHELAADGYRYKTHRRRVIRKRRDVNELASNEYLPPVQEAQIIAEPTNDYLPPVQEAAPAHELAADGYRYKTHRRVVYRRRH